MRMGLGHSACRLRRFAWLGHISFFLASLWVTEWMLLGTRTQVFLSEFQAVAPERITRLAAAFPGAAAGQAWMAVVSGLAGVFGAYSLLELANRALSWNLSRERLLSILGPSFSVYALGELLGLVLVRTGVIQFKHVLSVSTSVGLSSFYEVGAAPFQLYYVARMVTLFSVIAILICASRLASDLKISRVTSCLIVGSILILLVSVRILYIQDLETNYPGSFTGNFRVLGQ